MKSSPFVDVPRVFLPRSDGAKKARGSAIALLASLRLLLKHMGTVQLDGETAFTPEETRGYLLFVHCRSVKDDRNHMNHLQAPLAAHIIQKNPSRLSLWDIAGAAFV